MPKVWFSGKDGSYEPIKDSKQNKENIRLEWVIFNDICIVCVSCIFWHDAAFISLASLFWQFSASDDH